MLISDGVLAMFEKLRTFIRPVRPSGRMELDESDGDSVEGSRGGGTDRVIAVFSDDRLGTGGTEPEDSVEPYGADGYAEDRRVFTDTLGALRWGGTGSVGREELRTPVLLVKDEAIGNLDFLSSVGLGIGLGLRWVTTTCGCGRTTAVFGCGVRRVRHRPTSSLSLFF